MDERKGEKENGRVKREGGRKRKERRNEKKERRSKRKGRQGEGERRWKGKIRAGEETMNDDIPRGAT
jgi:hypothetical protein